MRIIINGFVTSKKSESYSDCADYYNFSKENHKFAVSDGVGKSFFPKIWSEKLVNTFTGESKLELEEIIIKSQLEWQKELDEIVKRPNAKWYTIKEYERKSPALATFVGLQFHEKDDEWSAYSLGDSFLFFVPLQFRDFEKEVIKLSSKPDLIFDNFPDYYTSIGTGHKGKVAEKREKIRNGSFYLMTDALAEWFIAEREKALDTIKTWKKDIDFQNFVTKARNDSILKDDDTTIMIITIEIDGNRELVYEVESFEHLKDLIERQESKNKEEILNPEKVEDTPPKEGIKLENGQQLGEGIDTNRDIQAPELGKPKEEEKKSKNIILRILEIIIFYIKCIIKWAK